MHSDTIIARATPQGIGAVAVVRVSGPQSIPISAVICGNSLSTQASHSMKLRKVSWKGKLLDEALVAVFKGPNSYTGEDSVELYLHGSDFIVNGVLKAFVDAGCRLAEAGEFTMRAFLNGKLDMARAEAVADLISANSEAEHTLALNQLKGSVSNKIAELRSKLIEFAALIELELDFGEEDVEFADRTQLRSMVNHLHGEVELLLNSFASGNAIKEGIPVSIVGKPNAGKSTLLNVLLGEERAIVTDIEGTTRDTIEESVIVDGIRYRFIDTAGIREADNEVEKIGIQRTYTAIVKSALVWYIVDASQYNEADILATVEDLRQHTSAEIWVVINKEELLPAGVRKEGIMISAKHAQIGPLIEKLKSYGAELKLKAGDTTISNVRHYSVLTSAKAAIEDVLVAMDNKLTGDLLAHHLRQAMNELGRILGEVDNDEILGEIFGKFCIGK